MAVIVRGSALVWTSPIAWAVLAIAALGGPTRRRDQPAASR